MGSMKSCFETHFFIDYNAEENDRYFETYSKFLTSLSTDILSSKGSCVVKYSEKWVPSIFTEIKN